ncbi:MAG: hypothetical protein GY810_09070 [Aureispira sp.]|nr:hypothetical protein [Aureispira sp.]
MMLFFVVIIDTMTQDSSKNKILQRIRKGIKKTTPIPYPEIENDKGIYPDRPEYLDVLFAEQFQKVGGHFVYCEHVEEFIANLDFLVKQKNWQHLYCWDKQLQAIFEQNDFRSCRIGKNLEKADVGITTCEGLIARTGTILLSSEQAAGRTLSIFPPVHIVVASTNQVVYNMKELLSVQKREQKKTPSMLCLTTGASRTADIEKTLVKGAHGPKDIYLFMLEG